MWGGRPRPAPDAYVRPFEPSEPATGSLGPGPYLVGPRRAVPELVSPDLDRKGQRQILAARVYYQGLRPGDCGRLRR